MGIPNNTYIIWNDKNLSNNMLKALKERWTHPKAVYVFAVVFGFCSFSKEHFDGHESSPRLG